MQPNSQVPTLNPIALSRLAGLCAIAFVLTALLGLTGALGGDLYFSDAGPNEILAWINQNGQLISLGAFLSGLETTLFYGGLIVLLVELTHARGILPVLAYLGVVITVLISWTQAGMAYAMVDLASRGGADVAKTALEDAVRLPEPVDHAHVGPIGRATEGIALDLVDRQLPAEAARDRLHEFGEDLLRMVLLGAGDEGRVARDVRHDEETVHRRDGTSALRDRMLWLKPR